MILTRKEDGEVCNVDAHQIEALNHLRAHPRAGLFLGMSLQKTVITLLYLREMIYEELAFACTLVVAPDKVARLTWPDEIEKWEETCEMRYSVVAGSPKARAKALEADAEIFIIGVNNLVWLIEQFAGVLPFECLVLDELSLFKGRGSLRFKKLRKALALSKVDYRVGLTGTPSPNGYIDLWAEMMLLDDGERLGRTFGKFVDRYFTPRGNGMIVFEYRPKDGAPKEIARKIADITLSMQTRDHLQLPDLILKDHELELDSFDREVYEFLERQYVLEFLRGGEVTVKTPADLINKLLQISSGAIYEDEREESARTWQEVNTAKLDALKSILDDFKDDNFLVIYQFRHEVERVKKRFPFARELPKGKRLKEVFDEWNRGEIKMLLLHPASAGHGLNLQFGGNRMIWLSPTWNLEHWQQTLARLLRRGAQKTIYVHRLLIRGTRDMQVKERVKGKENNQTFILNEIKQLKNKWASMATAEGVTAGRNM